jgi:hypothetical protein
MPDNKRVCYCPSPTDTTYEPGSGTVPAQDGQSAPALEGRLQDSRAQQIIEELREKISKTEEELENVRALLNETTLKLMKTEVELRTEKLVNAISQKYIPDDKLDEWAMDLPSRQLVWESEP